MSALLLFHAWCMLYFLPLAGAVCKAVDQVCTGKFTNAFCPIRPPGHHAGPAGVVTNKNDPIGSHGFCLLVYNTVSVLILSYDTDIVSQVLSNNIFLVRRITLLSLLPMHETCIVTKGSIKSQFLTSMCIMVLIATIVSREQELNVYVHYCACVLLRRKWHRRNHKLT